MTENYLQTFVFSKIGHHRRTTVTRLHHHRDFVGCLHHPYSTSKIRRPNRRHHRRPPSSPTPAAGSIHPRQHTTDRLTSFEWTALQPVSVIQIRELHTLKVSRVVIWRIALIRIICCCVCPEQGKLAIRNLPRYQWTGDVDTICEKLNTIP